MDLAFLHAAHAGDIPLVENLLAAGAKINAVDLNGKSALHFVVLANKPNWLQMMQFLVRKKINMNILDYFNKTPLHYAVENNTVGVVCELLRLGSNPDGRIPIKSSCTKKLLVWLKCINKSMLRDGFDYNETPLHIAVRKNYIQIAQVLLESGADIDVRDATGLQAIHEASRNNDLEMFVLLVERGADPFDRTVQGDTPLSQAHYFRNFRVAKYILELKNIDTTGYTDSELEQLIRANID